MRSSLSCLQELRPQAPRRYTRNPTKENMRNIGTQTSLDDYLNTSYEPDMDFVDGVLVRRNVGTQQHGSLQGRLVVYFDQYRRSHRLKVFPETRLLVNATTGRHRVPDIMVV